MMVKRLFLVIITFMVGLSVSAQEKVEDWLQNQRPECFISFSDSTEHRLAAKGIRRIGSQNTAPLRARGVQRVPVLLVAFPDMPFSVADVIERDSSDNILSVTKGTDEQVKIFYEKFCNGTMDGEYYRDHGSYGSIRDYFVEQSDSVFFPEFIVIGPIVLDNGYAYYGKNADNGARDPNFDDFTNESIKKAMEVYDNWDDFDNDGNGSIDLVFFVYAGMGENTTKKLYPDLIWPKEDTRSVTINGRVFDTHAATSEARPKKWNDDKTKVIETRTDGVGVFVHELSHALGLPDFYDTNNVAFGMDLWSVMDYGEYGNEGYTPGNYTAYERDFMGWRRMKTLEEPCVLTLSCFSDGGDGYKIQNDSSANEYYVIENRQPKGWDTSIGNMGHGLQVTHVDYNSGLWNANRVNTDEKHQRMTIIAANNNYTGTNVTTDKAVWKAAIAGQLFPGDTYNYNLTDETSPAAEVFTGMLMHKPLRNITENEDGTVTVCFRTNGYLGTPVLNKAENVDSTSFDIRWNAVDYATKYMYELYNDSLICLSNTIYDNVLHFEGLQPSSNLKLRVRAMADSPEDYLDSEWSDFAFITLMDDYITSISESDPIVDVYTMNGMRIARCNADEISRLSLRRGIYIIKYSRGYARRILIN